MLVRHSAVLKSSENVCVFNARTVIWVGREYSAWNVLGKILVLTRPACDHLRTAETSLALVLGATSPRSLQKHPRREAASFFWMLINNGTLLARESKMELLANDVLGGARNEFKRFSLRHSSK
jgi:hypothetical protein